MARTPKAQLVTAKAPQLVTLNEAAARLRVSRPQMYVLLKAGEITAVKIGVRTYFTEDELARFIADHTQASA